MQKFIKETTKKKLVIPNTVLELSGLEKGEPVEIRAADSAVIILRKGMTAMEVIRAVDSRSVRPLRELRRGRGVPRPAGADADHRTGSAPGGGWHPGERQTLRVAGK